MSVFATDQGNPQLTSTTQATVNINVIRNLNCPVFQNLPANITIQQSVQQNAILFNVSAFDADQFVRTIYYNCSVCTYNILQLFNLYIQYITTIQFVRTIYYNCSIYN